MMKVLLTNDDGVDSEALIPTIQCIESLGWGVEVIVPEAQRSGFSKATTRRGTLRIEERMIGDHNVKVLHGGTPADCVNLGIFWNERPDLLVSGANIGSNLDIGHFFASGTIGAAIEGVLLGVPSVAISLCYTDEELIEENYKKALEPLPKLLKLFAEGIQSIGGLSINYPMTQHYSGYHASKLGKLKISQLFEIEDHVVKLKKQKWQYTPEECELDSDRWAVAQGMSSIIGLDERGLPVEGGIIKDWIQKCGLEIKN